jgi:hypothetical protein
MKKIIALVIEVIGSLMTFAMYLVLAVLIAYSCSDYKGSYPGYCGKLTRDFKQELNKPDSIR